MIAAWMVYFACVAAIMTLAAHLAERALHERRLPARAAWVGSIVLSLALPVVISGFASAADRPPTLESLGLVEFHKPSLARETPIVWVAGHTRDRPVRRTVDDWLARSWLLASTLLAGVTVFACISMQWRLRRARIATLCGATVAVLEDMGPAVAGFVRPRIVVPEWLLLVNSDEQAAIVAHEREHLDARDSQLLGCAWLALIAMPTHYTADCHPDRKCGFSLMPRELRWRLAAARRWWTQTRREPISPRDTPESRWVT